MVPLVLLVAVGAVLLTRRKQANGAASPASDAGASSTGTASSSSSGQGVTWDTAWGTPNAWDAKYPAADPSRPIPYDPVDLDPTFRAKLEATFETMRGMGYDPRVFEGARSQHRQAWLYGQGRPDFPVYGRTGSKVTYILDASNHGRSPVTAVDVISTSQGWKNQAFFDALGPAAKAQGLRWGGDWKSLRDYPHLELP